MAEVTIQYTTKLVGHPEPNSRITVERTEMIEALLRAGYVVEIPPEEATNNIPTDLATGGIIPSGSGATLVNETGQETII